MQWIICPDLSQNQDPYCIVYIENKKQPYMNIHVRLFLLSMIPMF
jgi:hypothetical protein